MGGGLLDDNGTAGADREEGAQRKLNTLLGHYSNSSREMTLSQTDALLQSHNLQYDNLSNIL